jgi:hypothetical protein
MITTALTTWLVSLTTFVVLALVFHSEKKRGRRYIGSYLRGWLDRVVSKGSTLLERSWEHFNKYIVQLNWYYSIHGVLKGVLKTLVACYQYFENIFERNRKRTKELRAEKRQLSEYSHLQQMSEHRTETALTEAEKKKLKKKHLEGK